MVLNKVQCNGNIKMMLFLMDQRPGPSPRTLRDGGAGMHADAPRTYPMELSESEFIAEGGGLCIVNIS